jgi:hypothetical protein
MTRHPADLLSLGFGLFFTIVGVVLVVGEAIPISWAWVGPATVIALGAILIAAGWNRRERPPMAEADDSG